MQKGSIARIYRWSNTPIVVTTVPAKKKELLKSQLLGLVELPEGFTPFSHASKMTYKKERKNQSLLFKIPFTYWFSGLYIL